MIYGRARMQTQTDNQAKKAIHGREERKKRKKEEKRETDKQNERNYI